MDQVNSTELKFQCSTTLQIASVWIWSYGHSLMECCVRPEHEQAADSGLASYVAGQVDRTLSWKDVKWLQTITTMPILVKGVITAEDSKSSLSLSLSLSFCHLTSPHLSASACFIRQSVGGNTHRQLYG